jgi:hypothetical protein
MNECEWIFMDLDGIISYEFRWINMNLNEFVYIYLD